MKLHFPALALCLLPVAAGAAEAPRMAPDAVVARTWTGLFGGVSGGYTDGRLTGDAPILASNGISRPDPNGAIAEGFVGFQHQFDNRVVVGVEAALAFGDVSKAVAGGVVRVEAKVDQVASAKLRLGYAFERFLPFIDAGVAFSRVSYEGRFNLSHQFDPKSPMGWTAGVGVDYRLNDNLFLRTSYSFVSLEREYYLAQMSSTLGTKGFDLNEFKVGIGYGF